MADEIQRLQAIALLMQSQNYKAIANCYAVGFLLFPLYNVLSVKKAFTIPPQFLGLLHWWEDSEMDKFLSL